nr:unnamed protein product [Callosobruchus analis]
MRYTGLNLRGEVRESISFDDDDMSDVEDEVFIRDGKNGYKLAEDFNAKRPLMAPRRTGKSDANTRLKARPPCRAFCKPCCYVILSLSILIGLIILVVVVVSMFPLPIDKIRDWIIHKTPKEGASIKLLPCNNLRIRDVWTVNLPKLTTDSAIRTFDVNDDGFEDILFSFGTGHNYNVIPPDVFCPVFMGVPPPCEGGIIALNGVNGEILWRQWLNDSIFSIQCSADVNGDHTNDCLAIGEQGTIIVINAKNGSIIWQINSGRSNIFVGNFVPDQDNDGVWDVLTSHSSLDEEKDGHIILFSGKSGKQLWKLDTPNNAKTFYMPQILKYNDSSVFVLFGTGSTMGPGNLSAISLKSIDKLTNSSITIFQSKYEGILTQSVLADITGDGVQDIINSMYNSTVVAIDGSTFEQIWNFTVPGSYSETNLSPTPGYFNYDNVTDFLVVYQKYDDILNYNYTQTFIIDGKTGQSIYSPIPGSIITQMSGMVISSECHGYDTFLFWTSECANIEMFKIVDLPKANSDAPYDECKKQFNTSRIIKLNALSQFHQPPGYVIYNSVDRIPTEIKNFKSTTKQLKEYYTAHPKFRSLAPGQSELGENYKVDTKPIGIRKYGSSSFRHKPTNNGGLLKDYIPSEVSEQDTPEYDWSQNLNLDKIDPDFSDYPIEDTVPYNQKQLLLKDSKNRDPRSKTKKKTPTSVSTKKKNLSEIKSIYDYDNVRLARKRLMDDVDYVPTEILKDTFVKNEETRLRRSRFEQRDVNTHYDKIKEKEDIQKIIQKKLDEMKSNETMNLWQLESEKEMQDWSSGNYRGKRAANYSFESASKITSVGAILDSLNSTNETNTIDLVFITYWQPVNVQQQNTLKNDIQECIEDKIAVNLRDSASGYQKTTEKEQRALFKQECLEEQSNLRNTFAYYDRLHQLHLGQMTVYRITIECKCQTAKKYERCARFLPRKEQSWPEYLGRAGDGVFVPRG